MRMRDSECATYRQKGSNRSAAFKGKVNERQRKRVKRWFGEEEGKRGGWM